MNSHDLPDAIICYRYLPPELHTAKEINDAVIEGLKTGDPFFKTDVDKWVIGKVWWAFSKAAGIIDEDITVNSADGKIYVVPGWYCDRCRTTMFVADYQELYRHGEECRTRKTR